MKKSQLVRSRADIRHTQSNSVATRAVSVSLCALVAFTGLAISLAAPASAVSAAAAAAAASTPVASQATVTAAALADDVGYTSLQPARLLDTRTGSPTIDNAFAGGGALGQAGVVNLTVVGRGNVPATGVGAVVLNVTE